MANDIGIKSLLTEINVIKNELKQRGDELKKLKLREKDIKAKISSFLKEKNQPGVKDTQQGIAVVAEKVKKTVRKKKKEEKTDTLNVLRHYMDDNKAQKIYNEIENSRTLEKVEKEMIKIVKI